MKHPRCAILSLLLLLTACGQPGDEVQTTDLTGLYLGDGEGERQDRICMVTGPSGAVRFGIVTLEPDRAACSGIGRVERSETEVRLIMSGDEECEIPASMEGTALAFPAAVPDSCSYYCSPDTTLAGKAFEKTDDTVESAMSAADLVGNPLCR